MKIFRKILKKPLDKKIYIIKIENQIQN